MPAVAGGLGDGSPVPRISISADTRRRPRIGLIMPSPLLWVEHLVDGQVEEPRDMGGQRQRR
jgi:hypothetical protein